MPEFYNKNTLNKINKELTADVLDSIPGGIILFEFDGTAFRCIHCNKCFFKIFDSLPVPSDKLGKFTPYDYMYPEDIPDYLKLLEKCYDEGCDYDVNLRICPDGKNYLWYNVTGSVRDGDEEGVKIFFNVYNDINDLVTAKERLQIQEELKNTALGGVDPILWKYDPVTRTDTIISGNVDIDEEVVYRVPESLVRGGIVAEESADLCRKLYSAAAKGEKVSGKIKTFDKRKNQFRWKKLAFTPSISTLGKFVYSIGTLADIHEQVENEAIFNERICSVSAVNKDTVGVFRFNLPKNTCFDGYSKYAKVLNLQSSGSMDGFCESCCAQIPYELEKEAFKNNFGRKAIAQAFESGKFTITLEHHAYDKNNRIIWLSTTAELAKNPATLDIEGVIYSVNITKSKILEAIVSKIIEIDYDMMCIFRADDCKILSLHDNRNYNEFLQNASNSSLQTKMDFYMNYMRENIISPSSKEVMEKLSYDNIINELEKNEVYHVSFSIIDFDRNEKRKYLTITYLDSSKSDICCIQHDFTTEYMEQKVVNEQLASALASAERANSAKSEFLSRMSHEIRTPMNAIIGLADFGCDEAGDDVSKDYFRKIKSSSEYLLGIINDILDMSKIENRKITLTIAPYSVNSFSESVSAIVVPIMQNKSIDFKFELNDIYAPEVLTDRQRINQIFINLLSNAAKFTPEKGRVDFTIYQMYAGSGKVKTIFTVRDNGIGISEEFQQHLFEPFTQERNASTASVQGTGLGLTIVKNLVELMGGTIKVKSKLGEGTEFTVEIDFEVSKESGGGEAPLNKSYDFTGKRALIVEDHSINRILAVKLLKKIGFETDSVENGFEGLKKFIGSEIGYYDLVLMDIRMPVMDGLDAARNIRGLDRNDAETVKIIAMSANTFPEDIEKSKEAGMDGYVAKPVIPALLYSEIADKMSGSPR